MKQIKIVLGVLLIASKLYAWGASGHRIVAAVAQAHLTEETKVWLKNRFGVENLVWESTWSDDIRSAKGIKRHTDWHYAHFPESRDHKTHIFQGLVQSRDDMVRLDDKAARRDALRWYVHLVGDIHQPFHVTSKKLKGANGCFVKFFTPNRVSSLHSVWDSGLIDHEKLSFTEWALWLQQVQPSQMSDSQDPIVWAEESYQLNQKLMPPHSDDYCKRSHSERISRKKMPFLGWSYIYRVKPILRARLYQAGLRLAEQLNQMAKEA